METFWQIFAIIGGIVGCLLGIALLAWIAGTFRGSSEREEYLAAMEAGSRAEKEFKNCSEPRPRHEKMN